MTAGRNIRERVIKIRTTTSLVLMACLTLWAVAAGAQITINIPSFPKIKKNKPAANPTPSPAETTSTVDTNTSSDSDNSTGAASSGNVCTSDAVLSIFLKDIQDTQNEAENYKPGARAYYVSDYSDNENKYLKAALSPSRRKEWFNDFHDANLAQCVNGPLDRLAEAARKTLPTYTAPAYNVHNPAEEKLLLSAINDISEAKVFRTGLQAATWKIAKDSYNFPTARYKYGMVWARYPSRDDGFCRLIFVNIVQDYAGGGTYGDSYGNFIKSEYAGCPAGK